MQVVVLAHCCKFFIFGLSFWYSKLDSGPITISVKLRGHKKAQTHTHIYIYNIKLSKVFKNSGALPVNPPKGVRFEIDTLNLTVYRDQTSKKLFFELIQRFF